MNFDQFFDSPGGQIEELIEILTREGGAFGGPLNLDQEAPTGHDHIHVHLGIDVVVVFEIEQVGALDDTDRDSGHLVDDRVPAQYSPLHAIGEGIVEGNPGTGNGGGTGPSIGLKDVAVHPDHAFTHRFEIDHRTEGPPYQPRYLQGSPPLILIPTDALAGRAGQHAVFGRDPAFAGVSHPAGNLGFDGRGA